MTLIKSHQKVSSDSAHNTNLQTQSSSVHSTEAALQVCRHSQDAEEQFITSTCPASSGTGPDMESTRKRIGLPASHQSVHEPWSSPSSSSSRPIITFISPTSLHLLQLEQWQLKLPSDYYRPDTWYPLPCLIFRKFTSKPS